MRYAAILLTVLIFASNLFGQSGAARPNIIFMMIDDCSAVEYSCYATEKHPAGNQTPVLDALAEEGLRFNTCWSTPLCLPTRALLLSGKYGYQTGAYGNRLYKPEPNPDSFAKLHKPFSKVLKDSGYATAISGKWHLPGDPEQPEYGWDSYSMLGGYLTAYGDHLVWDGLWFSWSNAAKTFPDKAIVGKNSNKYPALYWHGCVIEDGKVLPSDANTYAPDLNQRFALDFIKQQHDSPFFLYYPIVLPHDPWFGTPDHQNPGQRTQPGFSSLIQRTEYYLDELITTVKQAGLYDNTLIFFTGDNATRGNGKAACSELGVRVPLIVAGGPLKKKGVTNVLVDFTDMYPTLLECAGVDLATIPGLNGKSFYPLLAGKPYTGRKYIFSSLDTERTVRSKDYMMDGSGGIWKCSDDGNILDCQAVPEGEEAQSIRASFMDYIKPFTKPTAEQFGAERLQKLTPKRPWPSHHPSMTQAIKNQDTWMYQNR